MTELAEAPRTRTDRTWRDRFTSLLRAHPVASVFTVALLLRAALAVGVAVTFDGPVFGDDGTYAGLAEAVLDGRWGVLDDYSRALYTTTAAFSLPLTGVFAVFGNSTLAGQLYVSLWGAAAAALTTVLARRVVPVGWALGAGLIVAVFPSQVLWSSLILKDAAVWAVAAGIGVVVAIVNQSLGRRLVAAVAGLGSLLLVLGFLRDHTLVVAGWSVAVAVWFGRPERRVERGAGVLILALVVPLLAGAGLGGWNVVTRSTNLAEVRELNAQGAATAFVEEPGTATDPNETSGTDPEESTGTGIDGAAGATEEAAPVAVEEPPVTVEAVVRGLSVMLLEPYPWAVSDNPSVEIARYESFLWWPLLALALVGIAVARRWPAVTVYPLLYAGGMTLVYALAEGNFGTAFRHRGELVWPAALFAALGAWWLWQRRPTDTTRQGTV